MSNVNNLNGPQMNARNKKTTIQLLKKTKNKKQPEPINNFRFTIIN